MIVNTTANPLYEEHSLLGRTPMEALRHPGIADAHPGRFVFTGDDGFLQTKQADEALVALGAQNPGGSFTGLSLPGLSIDGGAVSGAGQVLYEEGLWTPMPGGAGYSFTNIRQNNYVRIGRFCYAQAAFNAAPDGSGTLFVTGLPFTVGQDYSPPHNVVYVGAARYCIIQGRNNEVRFYNLTDGTAINASAISTGNLYVSLVFRIQG